MWARRLGCPALWPSRIKVLVMSYLLIGCIYTFFDFLRNADVNYVDLSSPLAPGLVICREAEPYCNGRDDSLKCILQFYERIFHAVDLDAAFDGECPNYHGHSDLCVDVNIPMRSIQGDLAMLHTVNRTFNPMKAWGWLYFVLMILLWSCMIVHDLALLQDWCRPKILSIRAAKWEMPLLWRCIASLQCVDPMAALRRRCCVLWLLLQPAWFACQVVIFLAVVYPLSLFAGAFWWCPLGPVRVSRIMVFMTGVLTLSWSLIFELGLLLAPVLGGADMYAVFWNSPARSPGCVCYCQYPLRQGITYNLLFFGFVAGAWSASIAFRALKGLRRPNWANLFSILYTVPIETFPVFWEKPEAAGGGPINLRKPGEPVQSEPAFDPFCLMDEQPESGRLRVHLFPVPQSDVQVKRWSKSRDPTADAEIGCCGFPARMSRGLPSSFTSSSTTVSPGTWEAPCSTTSPGEPPEAKTALAAAVDDCLSPQTPSASVASKFDLDLDAEAPAAAAAASGRPGRPPAGGRGRRSGSSERRALEVVRGSRSDEEESVSPRGSSQPPCMLQCNGWALNLLLPRWNGASGVARVRDRHQ